VAFDDSFCVLNVEFNVPIGTLRSCSDMFDSATVTTFGAG